MPRSVSSSSAMMAGIVVREPWPISTTELTMVTRPSRSIDTHWLGVRLPACARGAFPPARGRWKPTMRPVPIARLPLMRARRLILPWAILEAAITRLPS